MRGHFYIAPPGNLFPIAPKGHDVKGRGNTPSQRSIPPHLSPRRGMMNYDVVMSHPNDPFHHTCRPEGAWWITMRLCHIRTIHTTTPVAPKGDDGLRYGYVPSERSIPPNLSPRRGM